MSRRGRFGDGEGEGGDENGSRLGRGVDFVVVKWRRGAHQEFDTVCEGCCLLKTTKS